MRNVSYVGMFWMMILGLVAVALGEQQPPNTPQNAPLSAPQTIQDNTWQLKSRPQQAGLIAAPQDRSMITGATELPEPATNDGQPRRELGVWMGETGGPGVQILRITDGSAAEQAGLRVGDIILQVNGRGATSPQDTAKLIKQIAIGEKGALTLWRDGNQQQVQVSLQPVREIARETFKELSHRAGLGRSDSADSDLASRTMRLEQQIGSLTQQLATLRTELAQLRTTGTVQTGFNAEPIQSAPPQQPPVYQAAPQAAAPAPANPIAPPPGFDSYREKPTAPAANAAKPAAPPVATPAPTPIPAPAPAAEKSAPDDLFGSGSAQPKSEEKPKTEEKPKADDKAASDDLFK